MRFLHVYAEEEVNDPCNYRRVICRNRLASPLGYAIIYTWEEPILKKPMNLDQAVNEALATYNMSRNEEAQETGRTVATLQD